ncbi:MAG: exonuclease subunit SbcD [Ignavibacteriae bacterium]|nr:exonuclease subunit SbcD [Ignavibacteriota bacterium]
MKLLHTADWHLGKSLGTISRHSEQIQVLDEICEIADRENVDAVLIAGDLFDTFNPPVESVELFYRSVKRLAKDGNRVVVAIAGNHDSPERIESPDPLARECGILFLGYPNTKVQTFSLPSGLSVTKSDDGFVEIHIPGQDVPLRVVATPYANERRLRTYLGIENPEEQLRNILEERWKFICDKYCDDKGVNILIAHVFITPQTGEKLKEPDDEKPILDVGGAQAVFPENLPVNFQYVALGHLHRRIPMQKDTTPVVYSGSPLSYSVNDTEQAKSISIIDVNPGEPANCRKVDLVTGKRVHRKTFSSVIDAVRWLEANPNTLVELTIQSQTYLTAEERKGLYSAHDGIVDIIPLITTADQGKQPFLSPESLNKSVEELFRDYFKHETGQDPNEEIMTLLNEIMRAEEE